MYTNFLKYAAAVSAEACKPLNFNKGLAPSNGVARVGKANLPFSRRLYLPLNGEM